MPNLYPFFWALFLVALSSWPVAPALAQNDLTWNGSVSDDWFDADNWTGAGAPDATTDLLVPEGVSTMPVIVADTVAEADRFWLEENATLTLEPGSELRVAACEVAGEIVAADSTQPQTLVLTGGTNEVPDTLWLNNNAVSPGLQIIVDSGAFIVLGANVVLPSATNTFRVRTGGQLRFGGFFIAGDGSFILEDDGELWISDAVGIADESVDGIGVGNVRTGIRTYATGGIYRYVGPGIQTTGSGLPANGPVKLIIDTPDILGLEDSQTGNPVSLNITAGGRVEVIRGTFKEGLNNIVLFDGGALVMTGGEYQSFAEGMVPAAQDVTLTGGTFGLYSLADGQTLRGGIAYANVAFAGSSSGAKTVSESVTQVDTIFVFGNDLPTDPTVNVLAPFGGPETVLQMTGGVMSINTASGSVLPTAGGDYLLSGGTVTLVATAPVVALKTLRGNRTYHNVSILPTAVVINEPITLNNRFSIALGGRLGLTDLATISGGPGTTFEVFSGGGLAYGHPDGLNENGTGAINVDNLVLATDASYGFIGSLDMVTGTALPDSVSVLALDKTGGNVSLSKPLYVGVPTGLLPSGFFINETIGDQGNLQLGAFDLTIAAVPLIGASADGYLITNGDGRLVRSMTPGVRVVFPVGTTDDYLPLAINTGIEGDNFFATGVKPGVREDPTDPSSQSFDEQVVTATWIIENRNTIDLTSVNLVPFWSANLEGTNFDRTEAFPSVFETEAFIPIASPAVAADSNGLFSVVGTRDIRAGATIFLAVGSGADSPLPVQLVSFAGEWADGAARLQWQTASEQDNAGFEIERSRDGQRFARIGFVAGAGQSQQLQDYRFVDRQPGREAYYRLRQVDFDGTASYSRVVFLRGTEELPAPVVYPNPRRGQAVTIAWQGSALQLVVRNVTGQTVLQASGDGQAVGQALNQYLRTAPGGLLLLEFETGSGRYVRQLVD